MSFRFITVKFNPQDLWVGVFWETAKSPKGTYLDIWVCIIPMFPILFAFGPKETSA